MQLIRDGVIQLPPKNLTRNHYRLYDMIFRRFMTGQMKAAKLLMEKALINAGVGKVELEGGTLRFLRTGGRSSAPRPSGNYRGSNPERG